MRIVGGKYKSRVLTDFANIGVRPTGDKTRESFFNIVQFKIMGARFLDLFSGTGAMGIEAISRGAKKVVFNDSSRDSVKLIKKNLEKLKVEEDYELLNSDAIGLLGRIQQPFDIIYIDPPYQSDLGEAAVKAAVSAVNQDGIVVLESEKPVTFNADGFIISDQRKYGRAYLTFFKRG